jgi:glycosyltransferase involved in cell wall biosynthesis
MKISFVVPGTKTDISGGHIYNREIAKSLNSAANSAELIYGKNKTEIINILSLRHEVLLIDAWCLHEIDSEVLKQEFYLLVHHPLELDATLRKSSMNEQLFWNRAKSIIVTGEEVKEYLESKTTTPVSLVVPGIDILISEKQYHRTPVNIAGFGSYIERKGDLLLLEALKHTKSKIVINRYGPDSDVEFLIRLKTNILESSLSDQLILHEMVSHKAKFEIFKSTDLMVFPTLYESFGMAIQESLCYGIPVLTNDIPGLRNRFGESGIRYLKPNPLDWAKALETYSKSEHDYSQLCNELKEISFNWPTWQQQAGKIAGILSRK